ncbi:MAG: AbrB/MazE/SpoVT family DNA-binding domain-containing protein [Calditrichaeota bacterium]|nr:AbrB/MazE/SpoVT family DNA-binding domain-containing protein [Calditrichota bacterium]RQW07712.1 MAG: AbrB/MazE/SpoVT family DNA-binding domain-containing protein [Calditrichota bacterium]
METVTLSPKYQVVIPKKIRERLKVKKGQKFQVFFFAGRIELIPVKNIKDMRGFLKGIDTEIVRDQDRL